VPSNFPREREMSAVSYKFQNFLEGQESQQGRWASGPSMDGKGEFEYVAEPEPMGPEMDGLDPPVEPRLYSTPKPAHVSVRFVRRPMEGRGTHPDPSS
jgi:Mn-containing catalase